MSSIQTITEKGAEVVKLTEDLVAQAAASLVDSATGKTGALSLYEVRCRFEGARRMLKGEDAPTMTVAAEVEMTPLKIAEEMVKTYTFNEWTGASTFKMPAEVTDIEAMRAVNKYFRTHLSGFNRDAIYTWDFKWYEDTLPSRDASQARAVTIIAVVKGTEGKSRTEQYNLLGKRGLVFSDERDQALAAALHACKYAGKNLFQGKLVCGSLPEIALDSHPDYGVGVFGCSDDYDRKQHAASGTPSPESK